MASKKITPPRDQPEATPADTVDDLVRLTKELSPEQQEVLAQLGFVIPTGDIESALRGEYTIGYWCPYCNAIALYFVGSSWNGTMHELKGTRTLREIPPLGVPIDKIAWTQKGKLASQINRHQPVCQQCGSAVQFAHGRTLKAGYLRDVKRFEEARDKSHSRAEVAKLMSEVGGDQVGGLPSNYDDKRTVPSQFMSEEDKADVTALAQRYDPLAVVRKEG